MSDNIIMLCVIIFVSNYQTRMYIYLQIYVYFYKKI